VPGSTSRGSGVYFARQYFCQESRREKKSAFLSLLTGKLSRFVKYFVDLITGLVVAVGGSAACPPGIHAH
jgi:hypothetical protein